MKWASLKDVSCQDTLTCFIEDGVFDLNETHVTRLVVDLDQRDCFTGLWCCGRRMIRLSREAVFLFICDGAHAYVLAPSTYLLRLSVFSVRNGLSEIQWAKIVRRHIHDSRIRFADVAYEPVALLLSDLLVRPIRFRVSLWWTFGLTASTRVLFNLFLDLRCQFNLTCLLLSDVI